MAISDEEAYKQGKRIAEAMQQGTYNTSKDYSDRGSGNSGGSNMCKKCGKLGEDPVFCSHCGQTEWSTILIILILGVVLICIGVFFCNSGGWRWFWIIIGVIFILTVIGSIKKSLTFVIRQKRSKQATTTETKTQKLVEKTEASSHLPRTTELQSTNQTPDGILQEQNVNPLQNFDPVAQAQQRGKQRGMQYGNAGIESYRLLANALQSVPSLSASDSRLPKKTWHLSFDELIEKIDFHLGQSAVQGNVVPVIIRHGIFVFVNDDIEIAKVNEDSYLIWYDPHDPTVDFKTDASQQSKENKKRTNGTTMTDQEMVNKLIELARYYANGGLSADNRKLVSEVIKIGRTLDSRGGTNEMRRIFNMMPQMQGKRTVEMEWDGIGDWRG